MFYQILNDKNSALRELLSCKIWYDIYQIL